MDTGQGLVPNNQWSAAVAYSTWLESPGTHRSNVAWVANDARRASKQQMNGIPMRNLLRALWAAASRPGR